MTNLGIMYAQNIKFYYNMETSYMSATGSGPISTGLTILPSAAAAASPKKRPNHASSSNAHHIGTTIIPEIQATPKKARAFKAALPVAAAAASSPSPLTEGRHQTTSAFSDEAIAAYMARYTTTSEPTLSDSEEEDSYQSQTRAATYARMPDAPKAKKRNSDNPYSSAPVYQVTIAGHPYILEEIGRGDFKSANAFVSDGTLLIDGLSLNISQFIVKISNGTRIACISNFKEFTTSEDQLHQDFKTVGLKLPLRFVIPATIHQQGRAIVGQVELIQRLNPEAHVSATNPATLEFAKKYLTLIAKAEIKPISDFRPVNFLCGKQLILVDGKISYSDCAADEPLCIDWSGDKDDEDERLEEYLTRSVNYWALKDVNIFNALIADFPKDIKSLILLSQ